MPELQYFEGPQRIQREAVLDVLRSHYRKNALIKSAEIELRKCEILCVGKFGKPALILRRQNLSDLTVRIARNAG